MTGTPKVKDATTNAEWARNIDKRVDGTEHPTSSRVGKWVLSTDDDGNLIASFANGGSTVLAKVPSEQEDDPDLISVGLPMLKLNRAEPLSVGASQTVSVLWDSVVENRGEWGVSVPIQIVKVPVSGLYLVIYRLIEIDAGYYRVKGAVSVNGSRVMAHDYGGAEAMPLHAKTLYMADVIYMQAGSNIECTAFAIVANRFGANSFDPQNVTSLTVICLDKD